MRKTLVSLFAVLLLMNMAVAKPVSITDARRAAAMFLGIDENRLQPINQPLKTIHLFDITDGGFVLVSADDRVRPVLGYSLSHAFPVESMPVNLRGWLEAYDRQIAVAMSDDTMSQHPDWRRDGHSPKSVYESNVGPLVSTTWDQNPRYNALCPVVDNNDTTVTGCVATAMGQLMKYWSWPETGVGSHSYVDHLHGRLSADFSATTYQWEQMPTALTGASGDAAVTAVATLLYHCGVAVEMAYGTYAQGGSSAYDVMYDENLDFPCAENAFRTYFKYSPALRGVTRSCFTNDDWAELLKNEIDSQRPMLYGGSGPAGGHAFICDGYDTNGFFHFNWGYGGWGDGFFSLSNLRIEGDLAFNNTQSAIVGIEPDMLWGSGATCTVTAVSANPEIGSVQGGGTYAYRDTVILKAIPAEGCRFYCWSNGVEVNPYPLLAHDMSVQAIFVEEVFEEENVLSYTGSRTTDRDFYGLAPNHRMGVRFPVSILQGHDSVLAVEVYDHLNEYIINLHIGGENAPGAVVHSQRYTCNTDAFEWSRITLDSLVAVNPDSNLWVTVQMTDEYSILFGALGVSSPDANWFSDDNGATWGHLNEYTPLTSWFNPNISWFIRCITKSRSNVGVVTPYGSTASLSIWPNPTADVVHVALPVQGGVLTVYDATGRRVVETLAMEPVRTLDVSALPSGVYLLRYVTSSGCATARLMVR